MWCTPVTLFPLPSYVRQNPDYFRAIHDLGASVQDHTVTHRDLRRLGTGARQSEIRGPLDEFAAQFGARPWLFRPPFGVLHHRGGPDDRGVVRIAVPVTWRATINDGVLRTQGGPLRAGDIILMHFRSDLRILSYVARSRECALVAQQGDVVGTVRVVDEKDLEWHGGDPAMIEEILAVGRCLHSRGNSVQDTRAPPRFGDRA